MRRLPILPLFASLLTCTALSPAAFGEEALGRLFFTPERRLTLDRQRLQNWQAKREALNDSAHLRLDGVVRRSSGRHTAWINGNTIDEKSAAGDLHFPHARLAPADRIEINTGTGRQALRVGDSFNHDNGEREALLPPGQIRIRQRPAQEHR